MSEKKEVKGYVSVSTKEITEHMNQTHPKLMKQAFKGNVEDKEITFPKGIGTEHPFDFKQVEEVVDSVGIVNAAVDKITDFIMGDFTIEVNDPNDQEMIDSFVEDSNFLLHLRPWIKEGISKGNGFMDLTDIDEDQLQVLNANNMFVKRTKKGKILRYNQFIGKKNRMSVADPNAVVPFEKNEIAHLKVNSDPGEAYGIGMVHPNRVTINHILSSEIDYHKVLSKKAAAKFHVKVGPEGENTQPSDVDEVKNALNFISNSTEYVTDGNVKIEVLEFKDLGKNFIDAANHDIEQFAIGMQIPLVLLGVSNIPEGLAKEQGKSFKRFIESIRRQVEDIIEKEILRVKLRLSNRDAKIEFNWELPTDEDKDKKLTVLNTSLSNPLLSPELRAALEIEYAEILGLQDLTELLTKPEDAEAKAEEQRKKEEEIKQLEVPGAKPTAKQSEEPILTENEENVNKEEITNVDVNIETEPLIEQEISEEDLMDMTLYEYVNITEIPGFNYADYLVKILQALRTDKFEELLATTEQQLLEGLLPESDINKLRVILNDGFKKNRTIREIEKDINQGINLKDRVKFNEDGSKHITLRAEKRPNMIARTETVRLANKGLKDLYQENDIKRYRYLAALDDRTSDICTSLNGRVFDVTDGTPGVNMPPMHVNCRSTIVGLVE